MFTLAAVATRSSVDSVSWANAGSRVSRPPKAERSLLPAEEDTYAILSWRLDNLDPASRWYPVMQRYLGYLAERVKKLQKLTKEICKERIESYAKIEESG